MATYLPSHELVIDHISSALDDHRHTFQPSSFNTLAPPLFVGLQAPQGAGKTTLAKRVLQTLTQPPHSLKIVIFSLDDLYLTHDELVKLAQDNSTNGLLRGRGQPGTHDVELGSSILQGLQCINEPGAPSIHIPFFDKSMFDGEGDRSPTGGRTVEGPVDVVLFEGWCMGFYPLEEEELETRYSKVTNSPNPPAYTIDVKMLVGKHSLAHLKAVNSYLRPYAEKLYPYFETMVVIATPSQDPYAPIYKWRLQQEHHMKAENGGKGMDDDGVRAFIDRYIPGYVLFSGGVIQGYGTVSEGLSSTLGETSAFHPPWKGATIKLTISENRDVVAINRL